MSDNGVNSQFIAFVEDRETGRGGDRGKSHISLSPCLLVSLSASFYG
jgi:hypothetical protein